MKFIKIRKSGGSTSHHDWLTSVTNYRICIFLSFVFRRTFKVLSCWLPLCTGPSRQLDRVRAGTTGGENRATEWWHPPGAYHYIKSTVDADKVKLGKIYRKALNKFSFLYSSVGGAVGGASGPGSSPGRGHCVVFSGKTLYSLPLSTQVYKWVPANCWGNLTKLRRSDLRWTSIPSRGSRNTSSRFMLQKRG